MSLSDQIYFFLCSRPTSYKRLRASMMGDTRLRDEYEAIKAERIKNEIKDESVRVALSRLRSKGLVENDDGIWNVTDKWNFLIKKKKERESLQGDIKNKNKGSTMLVMFDIPETKQINRAWLRKELIYLGFKMLQKSIWFGPAPLPKYFIDDLKYLDLVQYLKFFDAKESDII